MAKAKPDSVNLYSENVWVLYWYQQWQQQQPQAKAHLCAYLQEPCYWAANRVITRFGRVHFALPDGFQIAIAHLPRILERYNPTYGSSLKAYARSAFGNCIRDRLRQQQTVNICSDWGLLRKLSRTQLREALLVAGFAQTEPFVLAWKCFNAVCTPEPGRSARSLPKPSPSQFEQMVKRYNQLRTQLSPVLAQTDATTLATTLQQSVEAARTYLTPAVTSLDQAEQTGEQLSAPEGNSPMALLIAAETYAEQQYRQQQIGNVLAAAIAALDPDSQTLLRLYYQQSMTQTEIAKKLSIKQYQVSRKLSRIYRKLLLSVAQWSQETLHISLDSSILVSVSDLIHEWLAHHY